jgi:hypothetical protein
MAFPRSALFAGSGPFSGPGPLQPAELSETLANAPLDAIAQSTAPDPRPASSNDHRVVQPSASVQPIDDGGESQQQHERQLAPPLANCRVPPHNGTRNPEAGTPLRRPAWAGTKNQVKLNHGDTETRRKQEEIQHDLCKGKVRGRVVRIPRSRFSLLRVSVTPWLRNLSRRANDGPAEHHFRIAAGRLFPRRVGSQEDRRLRGRRPASITDRQKYWHKKFEPIPCDSVADFDTFMGHEIAHTIKRSRDAGEQAGHDPPRRADGHVPLGGLFPQGVGRRLRHVYGFNMDEWSDAQGNTLPPSNPGAFQYAMEQAFYGPLGKLTVPKTSGTSPRKTCCRPIMRSSAS